MGEKHYELGDALVADKVMAQARKIEKPKLIQLSGRHKGQRVSLAGTVYCVIAKPLKARSNKRSSSSPDRRPKR